MLHHISFGVEDLARSGAFYDAALGALGYHRVFQCADAIGYGFVIDSSEDIFCLKLRDNAKCPGGGFHVAFSAPSRKAVREFHEYGLRFGGQDNGHPGLRPNYGAHYFASFLIDPDGYCIEAVIQTPAEEKEE